MRKELTFVNEVRNKPVTVHTSGLVDQNKRYVIGVRIERIVDNNGNFLDLKTIPIDLLSKFMEMGEKLLEENNFAHQN